MHSHEFISRIHLFIDPHFFVEMKTPLRPEFVFRGFSQQRIRHYDRYCSNHKLKEFPRLFISPIDLFEKLHSLLKFMTSIKTSFKIWQGIYRHDQYIVFVQFLVKNWGAEHLIFHTESICSRFAFEIITKIASFMFRISHQFPWKAPG